MACVDNRAKERVLDHPRFVGCEHEKHHNLLRQHIIQSMKSLYDEQNDEAVLARAHRLLTEEREVKYRTRYQAILTVK
ncbi:MAG: hypothetical protein MUP62_05195 [Dehalococcoidia bacterium]|nr:hypothetical protein [Dehalococcoidia bacterium]